ncbi:MAG: aspartyl-tRNA amidotransferase [Dehalococcoidia bacterium]|nr:aspartyl-tRNA amidotransferase [Dehalococcoidia bacterium]|tara:strand:- start:2384 stop:2827 length:444 start_codon:yes stop_codon:yes gene_type:complete
MSLNERLTEDLKQAIKSKDSNKRDVLRFLMSAIHYREIESKEPLSDDEILSVISKQVKQRKETIEASLSTRPELAAKEQAELDILITYLPKQLTSEELTSIITTAITDLQKQGVPDQGIVMKTVMAQVKGKASGKTVSEIVQDLLSR